jgi:hypothetical protein
VIFTNSPPLLCRIPPCEPLSTLLPFFPLNMSNLSPSQALLFWKGPPSDHNPLMTSSSFTERRANADLHSGLDSASKRVLLAGYPQLVALLWLRLPLAWRGSQPTLLYCRAADVGSWAAWWMLVYSWSRCSFKSYPQDPSVAPPALSVVRVHCDWWACFKPPRHREELAADLDNRPVVLRSQSTTCSSVRRS